MSGTGWGGLLSQAAILSNIASNLIPVQKLITGSAYVIGAAFAFKAIQSLKAFGESKAMMSSNANFKEPLVYMLVAAIFIYFPTGLAIALQTTFGSSAPTAYGPISSSNQAISWLGGSPLFGRPLTIIIQTIGLIAFIRGWILIARTASSGQPPGGTGKGLMHVFGGILAMNIVATLEIVNNTLYGG
jgi:intracellular multiplication protein IcmC